MQPTIQTGQPTPKWIPRLKRLLSIVVTIYSLFILAALVLHFVPEDVSMLIAILNNNLILLLLPSLILLPLLLILRRWRGAGLLVPAVGMFLISYVPLYLPRTVPVPPDARHISLMTYNLQAEEDLLDPMVAVLRESDADVIALQEMSYKAALRFEAKVADLYPYRALHPVSSPYHGRGVLSRFPLLNDHAWQETFPIPVRLQRIEIDVDGTIITLYNFHAPPSVPIFQGAIDVRPRAQQIADMLALAAADSGPILLMGDFNTTDMDENYRRITANFADTFREVGWGMGFTNPDWQHDNPRRGASFMPMYQRIDYVFHNQFFIPVEARVWPSSGGSDHRPLFAVLALK
jgi:vancomycin resistance protein VanJ